MVVYTYSITAVFSHLGVNTAQLQEEINTSQIIPDCTYIDTIGDEIYINFATSLNTSETTTLNNIIAEHVYVIPITPLSVIIIPPKLDSTTNTTYTKFGSYTYLGSKQESIIRAIYFVGYMDTGVTDYSIRIVDITNNAIISEATFNNITEQSLGLTTITNIPTTKATLELQFKKNGGVTTKRVYISSLILYA